MHLTKKISNNTPIPSLCP